jgi:outer membrane protein W
MKRFLTACLITLGLSTGMYAQNSMTNTSFEKGKLYVGPDFGLVFDGINLGISADYGLTNNFGLGFSIGYSSMTESYTYSTPDVVFYGHTIPGTSTTFDYDNKLFSALLTGTYHFSPKERLDPFVKAGIGYFAWSDDLSIPSSLSGGGTTSV